MKEPVTDGVQHEVTSQVTEGPVPNHSSDQCRPLVLVRVLKAGTAAATQQHGTWLHRSQVGVPGFKTQFS